MGANSSDGEDFGDIDENDLFLAASQTETLISSQRRPLQELSSNRTWTPPASQSQSIAAPKLLTRAPPKPCPVQNTLTSSQSQPPAGGLGQGLGHYRFTFGKHKGQKVDEVPEGYISFLRNNGLLARTPALNAAVVELEREKAERKAALRALMAPSSSQVATSVAVPAPAPPPFRFPFGMHKNKTLSEVPQHYLLYIKAQGLVDEIPGLPAALGSFEHSSATPPASSPSMSGSMAPTSSASTSSLPPSNSQIRETVMPNAQTYRFTFGLHTGKSLAEVPQDYLTFLNDRDLIASKPDLTAAFIDYQRQNPSLSAPPDPSQYTLTFGRHKGLTLPAVPPSYIQYLKDENIDLKLPDLAAALYYFEKHNKKAHKEKARKGGSSSKLTKPFEVPSDRTSDIKRFFRNGSQMWITASAARTFFGAETQALLAAGVRKMSTARSKGGTRFWLHQVFYFAKHFKTTGSDTPTKALNKFKAQN